MPNPTTDPLLHPEPCDGLHAVATEDDDCPDCVDHTEVRKSIERSAKELAMNARKLREKLEHIDDEIREINEPLESARLTEIGVSLSAVIAEIEDIENAADDLASEAAL